MASNHQSDIGSLNRNCQFVAPVHAPYWSRTTRGPSGGITTRLTLRPPLWPYVGHGSPWSTYDKNGDGVGQADGWVRS